MNKQNRKLKKNHNAEYMKPQNDFIFKRIFGIEGISEEITKDLISNIIGQRIKSIKLKQLKKCFLKD